MPPLRPLLVPRPRLLQHLNRGADGKLILVSAPAGFGKTTLVTHWLQQQQKPVAWLSLDENDNVPRRFFTYLIAAMQTVHPQLGQSLVASLHSTKPPEDADVIPALVNELVAEDAPLVLVLDDYHLIQNSTIHEALDFLVNYMPAHIHLVMTSREDPDLPLPRWRVRGQITEVRAQDLRFTQEEATAFLQTTMGLALDDTAVSQLEARTEGWVAGLQLAALSIQQGVDVAQFVQDFAGDDRQVADYLLQEVLLQQSDAVQQFLLQTSILKRLNASLCDALLQQAHSQDILDQLESSNLFLTPLDAQRNWYRYHHLFAQLLHSRLLRDVPETAVAELHRRAAGWFAGQNLIEEAVAHARQIPDDDYTAQLIAAMPMPGILDQDGMSLIQQWVDALPSDVVKQYPRVAVYAAGAHLLVGEARQVEHYLNLISDDEATIGERALYQSILLRNKNADHAEALRLAQKALAHIPEDEIDFRAMASMQIGVNQCQLGELEQAEKTLQTMRQQLQGSRKSAFSSEIQAIQQLSSMATMRGDLFRAEQLCYEGLTLAEESEQQTNPFVGLLHAQLARIYYEWNDWERTQVHGDEATNWAKRTAVSDIVIEAHLIQARLACWQDDRSRLEQALQKLRQYVEKSHLESIQAIFDTVTAYFHWLIGDLDTGVRWANASKLSFDDVPTYDKFYGYEVLCQIRLSELQQLGERQSAAAILKLNERMVQLAKKVRDVRGMTTNLCIQALAHDWVGNGEAAQSALAEALALAEPGSSIRLFVDFGAPMQALLARSRTLNPAYVARLLLAFADGKTAVSSQETRPPSQLENIHLTEREMDVLQAIAAGMSNKEIEASLVISKNTVRTHIKNLYSKLGVESRTQAIVRAQELSLISPP